MAAHDDAWSHDHVEKCTNTDIERNFCFHHLIGRGGFASVLLVSEKRTGQPRAIKAVPKQVVENGGRHAKRRALLELEVLQCYSSRNPFLVQLTSLRSGPDHWFLVLEYCPGGSLSAHLREARRQYRARREERLQHRAEVAARNIAPCHSSVFSRGIGEAKSRFYAVQILCAVSFLHRNGILHRDLKPSNVLVGTDGHVRLTDFGTCKDLGCNAESASDSDLRRLGTKLGTTDYMAPEVLRGHEYGKGADWWSFGVLLHELILGTLPFTGHCESDVIGMIVTDVDPTIIDRHGVLSVESVDLLLLLIRKDSNSRFGSAPMGAQKILEHPWFLLGDANVDSIRNRACQPPWKPELRKGALDIEWVNKKWLDQNWSLPGTAVEVGPHRVGGVTVDEQRPRSLEPLSEKRAPLKPSLDALLFMFCCGEAREAGGPSPSPRS